MTQQNEKQENIFLNIILNIAIPTIILMKFSGEEHLGVRNGLIVALAFPIIYGITDFFRAHKVNIFSVIAVVSILLTGGISLLQLDPKYIAIKEAAIPSLIGIATIISMYTRYPLLKTILYNEKIVQIDRVSAALKHHNNESNFESSFRVASYILACSFFLSAVLNYGLARYLLQSPPGTEEFNAELGRMTALSFPVITIPSMLVMIGSLVYLYRRITALTHLTLEEIFHDPESQKNANSTTSTTTTEK